MADAIDMDALRASVTKQGATVRELKKGGAPQVSARAHRMGR